MNCLLLVLVFGCAGVQLPPPEPPGRVEVTAPADDLPGIASFIPGQRAPFVDASCIAIGRGQVLPESRAIEVLQNQRDLTWWRQYGATSYSSLASCSEERNAWKRRYWAGIAGGIGAGFLLGYVAGIL